MALLEGEVDGELVFKRDLFGLDLVLGEVGVVIKAGADGKLAWGRVGQVVANERVLALGVGEAHLMIIVRFMIYWG